MYCVRDSVLIDWRTDWLNGWLTASPCLTDVALIGSVAFASPLIDSISHVFSVVLLLVTLYPLVKSNLQFIGNCRARCVIASRSAHRAPNISQLMLLSDLAGLSESETCRGGIFEPIPCKCQPYAIYLIYIELDEALRAFMMSWKYSFIYIEILDRKIVILCIEWELYINSMIQLHYTYVCRLVRGNRTSALFLLKLNIWFLNSLGI